MFIYLVLNSSKLEKSLIKLLIDLIKFLLHFHHRNVVHVILSDRERIFDLNFTLFVILNKIRRFFSKSIDQVLDLKHVLVDQIFIDPRSDFSMFLLNSLSIDWNFCNLKMEHFLNKINVLLDFWLKIFVKIDCWL